MITTISNCNSATLDVYVPSPDNPWDTQKAKHLYRRLGFGATFKMIKEALSTTPSQLIDALIDEAIDKNVTSPPEWAYWVKENFDNTGKAPFEFRKEMKRQMVKDLFLDNLRGRLTLFWSNHFVTEGQVYASPAYMYEYYTLLQYHAIGNFKEFTRDIGLNPAMLMYLNGRQNTKNKPNENYARELYELFTLGVDNGYTQQDIVETARALTGWNTIKIPWGDITFEPKNFDNGNKTIFGQTGNWAYEDVISILFDERIKQIAAYICQKLYTYFVSPEVDQTIVNQMAQTFEDHNFEIAPVLKQLFKSEHFFNISSIGALIKSPCDLQISFFKELEFELPLAFEFPEKIRSACRDLGQTLLSPIDVAGWKGDTHWINSSTLIGRWNILNWYIWRSHTFKKEQFRDLAIRIMKDDPKTTNVQLISRRIVDHFLSRPLSDPNEYEQALAIFKDEVPENYFENGIWSLQHSMVPWQVYQLLQHLIRIPEFQLK